MDIKQHLKQERIELVSHLKSLTESGRHDEVLRIVEPMLFENEDDHAALFYAASALNGTHHKEVAYLLSKRLVALSPEREEVWQQMGHIADLNWKYQEALYSYTKAFTLNPNNHQNVACATVTGCTTHIRPGLLYLRARWTSTSHPATG